MKLVDILARELKVWPEGSVTAVQDSDGEVKFDDSPEFPVLEISRLVWIRRGNTGGTIRLQEVSSDNTISIVTRAQWQAAVDALKAEKVPAWDGVGLPPVDLPCQWHSDSQTGWQEVVVLAYSGESAWIQPKGKPSIIVGNPANFRPIRTPEQIAKQERSKACDKMYGVILDKIPQDRRNNGSDICEALYDAGYRKFEIVDN